MEVANDNQNQQISTPVVSSASVEKLSGNSPSMSATSIAELLSSRGPKTSLNAASPLSSSNNMTTLVPHQTDVTAPCTSSGSASTPNASNFRSSPFPDSAKPLTTAPAIGVGLSSSNLMSNMNGSKPMSNIQIAPYHNHLRPDQQPGGHVAVRGKTDPAMAPYICAKCSKKIVDRYLLEALDKYWHEDCLKCDACDGRLGELGSKLYFKNNNILCQRDYLRIFRPTGTCAACAKTIPAFEQVMRAGANVYHLECFACQECNHRFCIGDKFYLDVDHNKILCEYDYEERMVFAQMAYNYNSLAQLKRQISQQVDDFDEVQPVPPR